MTPRIILIGPPGAGKTSVGRSLAKSLALDFVDTDSLIELDQGKSISQIFVDEGEPYFRSVEERICLSALTERTGVLSLGGGAVLSAAVAKALTDGDAQIIFLDVTLAVAAPRVGFNRDRPLLLTNPRAQWQNLMDKRRPTYEYLATIHCQVGTLSVSKIVASLLVKVGQ